MKQVIVFKGRTTTITISLPYDVSEDEITSEIRAEISRESDLLATWVVTFLTDGKDGELVLTLDDSNSEIDKTIGYMDLKRVSAGEPLKVFDEPMEVLFKETITA